MKEYAVTIKETLAMKVYVRAKDKTDAEQIVSDRWHNFEYILDADSFAGVTFDAEEQKRDRGLER